MEGSLGARTQHRRICRTVFVWLLMVTIFMYAVAAQATADQTRTYTGVSFGSDGVAGTEAFKRPLTITVDQSTGDVFVYDGFAQRIYKFDGAGKPINFSSTQTNSIPVQTVGSVAQLAVAPAGSAGGTEGDIYLAAYVNRPAPAVSVYAASGTQLGAFGPETEDACGVATDSSGRIIFSAKRKIYEYEPTTNPPTNSDFVQASNPEKPFQSCTLGQDDEGHIYALELSEHAAAYRFEGITDPRPTRLNFKSSTVAVDPEIGVLFADTGNEVEEYLKGANTKLGSFGAGELEGSLAVAASPATDKVYVSDSQTGKIKVFGSPVTVPTVTAGQTSFPAPTEAVVTGSVDSEGTAITECFVEYGTAENEYEPGPGPSCTALPPSDSESHQVEARLTGLQPNTTYHYRLVVGEASGVGRTSDQTFTTPSTVQTLSPGAITETTAVATGRLFLFPDQDRYTACEFEYEEIAEGSSSTVGCSPDPEQIGPDHEYHRVTAELTGLRPNHTAYRVRIRATTTLGGTVEGEWVNFATNGGPLISGIRAADADERSATLEATIDPGGFQTSYRIEWGPTESYGSTATTGSLGPSEGPTKIFARIEDLSAGSIYHYRIVASNESAQNVASLDHEAETLDDCGLPQLRCFELASEREPGPSASPGRPITGLVENEPFGQAAERSGALAYISESGYRGATRGGELFYRATRGLEGWSSSQLSPPVVARDETDTESSISSRTLALSPELSCGVIETSQPLAGTTARMHEVIEAGGKNLYRLNPDGTYTPITTLPPEDLSPPALSDFAFAFHYVGMGPTCSQVYFTSIYRYPGTPAVENEDKFRLYEWTGGRIQAVGSIPGEEGEVPVAATPGNDLSYVSRADRNAVSRDGRQIFFTADRVVGNDPGEVGQPGLFARRAEASVLDVSASETATPDTDPQYQWATPDGSKVFFTAPAGLTTESNTEGTDLYVYNLDASPSGHPLRDLSVDSLGTEADVVGMVGGSDDGSRVYFAGTGRLVTGEGLSAQQNREEGTYSLYLSEESVLRFVATVKEPQAGGTSSQPGKRLLLPYSSSVTSQSSPDGRYLIFESMPNSGGSAGLPEVYLFDSAAPREALSCVSCVPSGRVSARGSGYQQLPGPGATGPELALSPPRALVMTEGLPSVIFSSRDALAPGASEGETNLFEWTHDQVFLITAEPPGLADPGADESEYRARTVYSLGSGTDGTDLYFSTVSSLTGEDADERSSVYDARIGGGFPQPTAPSPACDPTGEGACQGSSSSPPTASPGTPGFVGPGNPKPARCRKGYVKKHGRCRKRKHYRKQHRTKSSRHAKVRGSKPSGKRKGDERRRAAK